MNLTEAIDMTNKVKSLAKAQDKLKLKRAQRIWIQKTNKLNILNYWWYRYCTNDFIHFILSEEFKQ